MEAVRDGLEQGLRRSEIQLRKQYSSLRRILQNNLRLHLPPPATSCRWCRN